MGRLHYHGEMVELPSYSRFLPQGQTKEKQAGTQVLKERRWETLAESVLRGQRKEKKKKSNSAKQKDEMVERYKIFRA